MRAVRACVHACGAVRCGARAVLVRCDPIHSVIHSRAKKSAKSIRPFVEVGVGVLRFTASLTCCPNNGRTWTRISNDGGGHRPSAKSSIERAEGVSVAVAVREAHTTRRCPSRWCSVARAREAGPCVSARERVCFPHRRRRRPRPCPRRRPPRRPSRPPPLRSLLRHTSHSTRTNTLLGNRVHLS